TPDEFVIRVVSKTEAGRCPSTASVFPLGFSRQTIMIICWQPARVLLLLTEQCAEVRRVRPRQGLYRSARVTSKYARIVSHNRQVLRLRHKIFADEESLRERDRMLDLI